MSKYPNAKRFLQYDQSILVTSFNKACTLYSLICYSFYEPHRNPSQIERLYTTNNWVILSIHNQ